MHNQRRLIVSALMILSLMVFVLGVWVFLDIPKDNENLLPTLASLSDSMERESLVDVLPTIVPTDSVISQPSVIRSVEALPPIESIEQSIAGDNEPIAGQHILEFAEDMTATEITDYIESLDVQVVETLTELNRVVVLSTTETIDHIQAEQGITSEPDYYASALMTLPPANPYYRQQWNLEMIGAPAYWDALSENPTSVRIAVIDSGVCFDHPDMPTTYADFQYDYVENDTIPQDEYGHGCSVTGVIASQNNSIGTIGIAPFAEIMPLRVLDKNGIGSYSNIARAIIDATNQGVAIINLSLGGLQSSNTLKSAVDYALEHDVILVAAAGNSNGDAPLYPARYDGVIAVGSINQRGGISSFNHLGIDLFAPGEAIIVPYINNDYVLSSGTSLAAPHVTGVIALKLSIGEPFSPIDPILIALPDVIQVDEDLTDDPIVFGDILIPRKYAIDGDEANALFTFGAYGVNRWTNDIAYYSFAPNVSQTNKDRTRVAMDQWEAASNVRFVPRTNQSNYIYIQKNTGNNSYVGMLGGKQELNMANWEWKYIIVHELGHALGLWHEHTRGDRDSYIYVDYTEVEDAFVNQFYKRPSAATLGEYDFASVMHYDAYSFTKDGYPTIYVLPPNETRWQNRIGDVAYLSEWDAIGMWAAYPCANNSFDCVTLPLNDFFEDAIVIDQESFSHSITGGYGTAMATTSVDDPFPSCITGSRESGKSLWYKITIPSSLITINTNGSSYDRALSIWTGERGNYSEVACNRSGSVTFNPTLGTTYYAMVTGEYHTLLNYEAAGGDLYFNFEAEPVCYPFEEWITLTNPAAPACAPNAPSNLNAVALNYQEQIDLAWTDNSLYETAFQIERRINGESVWSIIGTADGDATSYADTRGACYTSYEYQVRAYRADDDKFSQASNITSAQSSCSTVTAPTNLVKISALNSIQVAWTDHAPDETSFSLERSPNNAGAWVEVGTSLENITTLTNASGLICGSTYDYRVRAYRAGDTNYSVYSNLLSVTLTCDPPLPPSNVAVDDIITITDLKISWQDNSSTETSFVVERQVSGTWQAVTTVGANITTTQDTNPSLSCYTDYTYRVKAYRIHDGKQSAYVSGTGKTSCETLFTPNNLLVTNSLNTIVTTWNNNSPDGTHFDIERSPTGANTWSLMATISADTNSYSDDDTICGSTYDYRVRQFRSNDSIYSEYSDIVTATQSCSPPITPSLLNLQALPLTRQITLSWQDNAFNESDYFVERFVDGNNWIEIASLGANSTTYSDTDNTLACYTPYFYRVRAYRSSDGVYSEYSNSSSLLTWCEPTLIGSANFTDSAPTHNLSNVIGFPFPNCGLNAKQANVWEFTPSENMRLSLNTFGSNFNTVLSVLRYDGAFTQMVCNDDASLDGTSATVATLSAGQRYILIVGGKNNISGSIKLNGSQLIPPTATPLPTATTIPSATPQANLTTVGLFKNGIWSFRDSNSSGASDIAVRYGTQFGDDWQPLVGDWNGDGSEGIGLYKEGRWYLRDMNGTITTNEYTFRFGAKESGWQAVVGDWDGDGIDGIGLYKDGLWQLKNTPSAGAVDYSFRFNATEGNNTIPLAGDWHNQAVDRVGLYQDGTWFLSYEHHTSNNALIFSFGSADSGWYPIRGDWDKDGDDTIGVYKDGIWRLRNSNSRGATDISFNFGGSGGIPIAGYRGGASALALLALSPDIQLSASEPIILSTATPFSDVTATMTLTPEPTFTAQATATLTLEPTFTAQPTVTWTATSEAPVIPQNTSGTD